MSKLIILGNGFDLQCGLNTRYSDFFNNQLLTNSAFSGYSNYVKIEQKTNWGFKELNGYIFTPELTAWDIYFIVKNRNINNWGDIEKEISDSLNFFWSDVARTVALHHNQINGSYQLDNIKRLMLEYFIYDSRLKQMKYIALSENALVDKFTNEVFYPFLLQQLELFESRFRQYVKNEIKAKEYDYYNNAWKLYLKLLSVELNNASIAAGSQALPPKTNVLCFNYTRPFEYNGIPMSMHFKQNNCLPICSNVHGSIDDDCSIFGIDPVYNNASGVHQLDWLKVDDPKYIFTKTYRKIARIACGIQYQSLANENTEHIIFYGHSLSEHDYSYFHTIFDMLDLYGSRNKDLKKEKIKLTFYFSDKHAKNDEEKMSIRISYMKAITALLSKYGETFDNRAHGKNLIDMLINEGRFEIKTLNLYE